MVEPYLVVCAVLLVASVAARALPVLPRFDADLTARHVAYLRRGRYGTVLTVLAELHAQGSVDASGPLTTREPPADLDDELAEAVYAGLRWPVPPWMLALSPAVRRACAPVRADLVEHGLLPPLRRRIFGYVALTYAAALALATAYEQGPRHSTVVSAAVVVGLAAVLAVGPRRTIAGFFAVRAERHLLAHLVASAAGPTDASLFVAMVAADGRAAFDLVCGEYVVVGGFPADEPIEPLIPIPTPVPVPLQRAGSRPAYRVGPVRDANTTRAYQRLTEGPAIVVRPAFV
jgi:uncharacterized protein (TIGR04222 family)